MPWFELDRYRWAKLLRLARYLPGWGRLVIIWRDADEDRRRIQEKRR